MTTSMQAYHHARPTVAHRIGYAVALCVNAGVIYAVNLDPGWRELPFLTRETLLALPLINTSLAAGILANLCYLYYDAWWFTGIGDLITTAIGLAAIINVWRVFPFDFTNSAGGWEPIAHLALGAATLGVAMAIVVKVFDLLGMTIVHLSRGVD